MKRYKHNLSHYRIFTAQPGELVPCGCVEVAPGDSFDHRTTSLVRFAPMLAPIMHRVQVRVHHFFVPFRLVWSDWEAFITAQTPAPTFPTVGLYSGFGAMDRLANLLGTPNEDSLDTGATVQISALALRSYNLIWNEWYRDQDLMSPLPVLNAVPADFQVQHICWAKDAYTAARPWPQKGADVTLPLGTEAPVVVDHAYSVGGATDYGNLEVHSSTDPDPVFASQVKLDDAPSSTGDFEIHGIADLTQATAATVNQLRRAMALQRYGERLAQFGSRYTDLLLSMGVKSSDARLQRPEYLGGGKVPLSFSEVLQTAEGTTTPVGEMRGHGIAPGSTRPYRRFFEEHGYVISLLSVRPQGVYSTVLPRHFLHGTVNGREDFWTPELERIGQQEVYYKEIFPGETTDDDVWGYNDRYYEYRHQPSQVAGEMSIGGTFDYWTWARGFSSPPALNEDFVACNPDDHIFADQSGSPGLLIGVNHRLIARRMITPFVVGRIL